MDPELKDLVIRSRPVVVELLEARGYDASAYLDQAPSAIAGLYLAASNQAAAGPLKIRGKRKEGSAAAKEYCEVVYLVFEKIKSNITKKPLDGPNRWPYIENTENTEYIFILNESYHEIFDLTAIQAWQKGIRLSFFNVKQLIFNPSKHSLVPPHERVPAGEVPNIKKQFNLIHLKQLPLIKYHIDMQSRWLGLVPGDIVKITRISPTSGEYIEYRYCSV